MKNSKKRRQKLTTRQEVFVEELPVHNWTVYKAGVAAGFSEHYARRRLPQIMCTNVALREAIERKKAQLKAKIEAEGTFTIERQLNKYTELYELAVRKHNYTAARGCLDSITKIIGGFAADNSQKTGLTITITPREQTRQIVSEQKALDSGELSR